MNKFFNIFLDDIKAEASSPSLVVITRPSQQQQQPVSIDLSKNAIPLSTISNGTSSITIYNIDESQASLNLSTESSGYVSNSTTSSLGNVSLNQSIVNGGDELEVDGKITTLIVDQRISIPSPSTFNALPMPPSTSSLNRRRTISSNSNR